MKCQMPNIKCQRLKIDICLLTFVLGFLTFGICPLALALPSVTVMADNTMSNAIAEIARHYARDRETVVNTSFAASAAQETQITEGAAADILITPKQSWIEQLKTQGLIDIYSPTAIARNRLALVGPEDSPIVANIAQKFPTVPIINRLGGEPGFVVGNPETQAAGVAGKEALRNLDVASDLEPYTLYVKQQNQMIEMVTQQQGYGLFFASSIMGRSGMRILDFLPESSYQPVKYYAVVIAGDNMDEARKFLDYLSSTDARQVFRQNGFNVD